VKKTFTCCFDWDYHSKLFVFSDPFGVTAFRAENLRCNIAGNILHFWDTVTSDLKWVYVECSPEALQTLQQTL